MGQFIVAKCHNCSFKTEFNFGGNKNNFQILCPVPSIQLKTLEFENINFIEHKDNLDYAFYSDKILKGNNVSNNTFKNFNLILNESNNYCPNCKGFKLSFNLKYLTD